MSQPYLSVVIPAYNEEQRLPRAIPAIAAVVAPKGEFEIVVVNDGSRDGTARVAEELSRAHPQVRVISYEPNRGKGNAVRVGMLAAAGRYILFTDADQSTSIVEMDKLLVKLERDGYDIAIGSRRMPGSVVVRAQSRLRALASRIFWMAVRLLALRGIADTQCGFKCMTREAARNIFPGVKTNTPIFDVEMLILAGRAGYHVAEIPVRWEHNPDTRIPYDFKRAVLTWRELMRILWHHRVFWPVRVNTEPPPQKV
jgi:dolichyl-phosphate beta-glucosyltransferase